jgi:transcription antitermination factor NusA-like protein
MTGLRQVFLTVAACVGRSAKRVGELRRILGEKVDIVAWHEDTVQFLVNSLQPADIAAVWYDEKKHIALVVTPDSQMSTAVGGGGLNAQLAGTMIGSAVRVVPMSKGGGIAERLGAPQYINTRGS